MAVAVFALAKEQSLAAVRVAQPFVEDQHPGEIMDVFDFAQLLVGQKVVQGHAARISGVSRAELETGTARRARARHFDAQRRSPADEIGIDFHDFDARHRKPHARGDAIAEQFIDQDAGVLGVVLEFHDAVDVVVLAVGAAHQVGLGAAAHAPDLFHGTYHSSNANDTEGGGLEARIFILERAPFQNGTGSKDGTDGVRM